MAALLIPQATSQSASRCKILGERLEATGTGSRVSGPRGTAT